MCELDGKESKEACGDSVRRDGVGGTGGVKGVDELSKGRKMSKKGSRVAVFRNHRAVLLCFDGVVDDVT